MKAKLQNQFLRAARLSLPPASAIAALLALATSSLHAVDGTWLGNTGNWSTTGTWASGTVATGVDGTANFTGVDITAAKTITVDTARTIGNITFTDATNSNNNLTISGTNILTLDVSSPAVPTINVTQSGRTLTISSVIAGSDGLTKSGAGQLTLSGANTYTGITTINASGGILSINAFPNGGVAGPLGQATAASSNLVMLGGQLTYSGGSTTTNRGLTLSGNSIITVSTAATNLNIAGVIAGGSIDFTKGAGGTLTLSGLNTFTGRTFVSGGTVAVNTINSTGGSTPSSLGIPAIGGGMISIGTTTTTTTLSYIGTGDTSNRVINLAGTTGGAILDQSGASGLLKFTSALTAGGVGAKTLTLQGSTAGTGELGGAIVDSSGGATALTKGGTGTWTISGANTYMGGTILNQGTLTLGASGTLGATTGTLAVNNTNTAAAGTAAILTLATATDTTVGSLSGAISTPLSGTNTAAINTQTGRNFNVNQTTAGTYAGAIAGDGSFTLGGLSTTTLTLTGANTYTGATLIAGGRLQLDGAAAAGTLTTSGVSVGAGSTLSFTAGTASTLNLTGKPLTLGGTVALDIGATGVNDALTVSDFNLTANSVLTFNPIVPVTSGGSYTLLTSTNPINAGVFSLTAQAIGKLTFTPTINTNTVTLTSSFDESAWNLTGGANWSAGGSWSSYLPTAAGDAALFGPAISAAAVITVDTPQTVGYMRFNSANAYTIGTNGSSNLTLDNGASSVQVVLTSGSHTIAENVTLASNLNVWADTGTALTLSGVLSGTKNLNNAGPGTLVIGGAGQLGGGSYVGAIANSGVFNFASSASQTLSGVISGTGTLTQSGPGTLTLTGANTYSGNTTVSAGILQLGNATVNGTVTSGLYQLSAGTTLYLNNATAVQAATGGWATRVRGSGTLRLNSAQTVTGIANWGPNLATATPFDPGFTGTLQVDKGRMDSSPAGLGGIPNIVINSGAQFLAWTGTYTQNFTLAGTGWGETGQPGALRTAGTGTNATFSGSITLTADAGFNSQDTSSVMTISGGISGGFGISKENPGPLTLSGTNTYTGATTLTSGTLQIKGSASLPAASAINLGLATLQYLDDGAGSNGTISRTGNNITLSIAGTASTIISVGNNGSANTGNTVAFGALNNGTTANAFNSTINFTGANGYLQSFSSLGLSGLTGNNTTLNPTTTSVTITGPVTNQESGTLTAHYDTLTLGGTSAGNAINGVISDNVGYVGPVGNGDTRVTKSGTSTWTLAGNNTYSGPTTISAGTLQLGNARALGLSTLTLGGGNLDSSVANLVNANNNVQAWNADFTFVGTQNLDLGTGAVTLNANRQVTVSAGTLTVGGAIGGAFSLTKAGPGALVLSGVNSYSGATTVSAGTLVISGTPSASAVTVKGGTLQLDYTATSTSKIDDATILTLAGGTLDLKGGAHSEIVTSTTLAAGTASRVTSSTPGSELRMFTITRGAGASIDFGSENIATTDNTNNALGILGTWATIGGIDFAVNSTNLPGGLITAYTGYTSVPRLNPGVIADGSGEVRLVEGSGLPGSITLSAATTTINILNQSASGGGSNAMIDSGGQALLTNGILVGTGAGALTIGNGTLATATAGGDLTLINNTANGLTINSVIADNATSTLTKTGTGPATLTEANTYAGGTILAAGTLQLANAGALGTGPLTIGGGNLDSIVAGLVNANNNPQAWNGNFTFIGTQALNLGIGAVTTNGARTVTVSANTLTVGGSFTPSVTAGSHLTKLGAGTLVLNGATALGDNGIIVNGGTVRFGGALTTNSAVAGAGVNTFRVGNLANASAAFVQTGGTINLSVTDVDGMNLGNADNASGAFGSLTIQGGTFTAPRLNVGGSGQTTGTNGVGLFNVLSGSTATLTAYMIGGRGVGNSGATTIAGGTLDLSGALLVSTHIGAWGGGRHEFNLGANLGGSNTGGLVTTGPNPFSTVASANTSIGITNLLGGTLLVNAVTSPAGAATGVGINQFNFNGGTLKAGTAANATFLPAIAAGAAPGSGVFVRSGGAIIDTNGQNPNVAAALLAPTGGEVTGITATGATGFIAAPYVKIVGGNNDATAVAQIDGNGNLTNIIVTNPGTGYATAPTVTLVGGTAAGGTNITTGTATATVGASTSGGLTKNGAGYLTLTGANTFSGVVTVNAGGLAIGSAAANSPSTSFVINSGGQLYGGWQIPGATFTNNLTISGLGFSEGIVFVGAVRASNNQTFSGSITLAAASRICMIEAAAACTFSGKITGNFALDVQGAFLNSGTQTFTLANPGTASDYSGDTTISAVDYSPGRTGTITVVRLGVGDQLPNGTGKGNLVFNGANADHLTVLELNGFNETLNGVSNTAAVGAIIRNTSTGASVLTIGDADTTSTFSGVIADGGVGKTLALTKTGTGSLTLSGANTYSGNTTVNAGTLTLSNGAAPANTNPGNDSSTVTIAATGAALDLTYTGTDIVDKLFIGATQMAAGVYGAGNIEIPQITGTGTLTVASSPVGFASWITGTFANGSVPVDKRGPNDDPDNDGIKNLIEYAIFGQDPTVGNAAIGTFTANTLSFTKRPGTNGLTYAIVQSTDLGLLVPWSEVPAGPTYTNNATTISYTLTPSTPVKNFVRLRVTQAP